VGKYRKKSPPQIVKELQTLRDRYGSQLFLLSDSLLNPVINGIAEELIAAQESIYWEGWLRADKPVGDTRNTQLWRRAGFYHARIGAESGSPRVLQLMGKKITPGQNPGSPVQPLPGRHQNLYPLDRRLSRRK